MEKQHTWYSVRDLSVFLNVSPQTIRNRLRESGLSDTCGIRRKILLSADTVLTFLAEHYPNAYNTFRDKESLSGTSEGDSMMQYPIPQSMGKIAKITQASGNTYYYIRSLPLYYDDNGKLVYYKGKGFTSKTKAIQARKALIKKRNAGLCKWEALQAKREDPPKHVVKRDRRNTEPPGREESYYEFCKAFILHRDIEEKTRRDYLHIVNTRIKAAFSQTPVSELTKGALQECIDQYDTNLPKMYIVLKMTLERLYALEKIPQNYYELLIRSHKKKAKKRKHALTREQITQFLSYFQGHRLEHAIYLIFYTGLREGELLALWWNDIELMDDEHGLVHVYASWGLTEIGYERKSTKTKTARTVPFASAYLISLLKNAKERSKSKWVVENSCGTGPIDPHNFSKRYFKDVSQTLGFNPAITSHYARHTYISYLLDKHVSAATTAKLAGHASTEMVIRVYAHPVAEREQEIEAVTNLYETRCKTADSSNNGTIDCTIGN